MSEASFNLILSSDCVKSSMWDRKEDYWQPFEDRAFEGLDDSFLQPGIDPPPLKWSDLRYVSDIQEDCNGKEAIQA